MGATPPHPSQRRFACETCRKQKSRCQRFKPEDPKCARCTLLNLECSNGQQRSIGRPRRTAASITSLTKVKPPTTMYTQTARDTVDWTNLMSPATTPTQDATVADINTMGSEIATWPMTGVDSFGQSSLSWDAFLGFADADYMFTHEATFEPSFYLTPSPPSTPSSDHGACLNKIHNVEIPGLGKVDSIDISTALLELSKINIDLHNRITAANTHKDSLKFDNVVQRDGPLYIDNVTLAEFVLKASLKLLQIVNRLLSNKQNLASNPLRPPQTKSQLQDLIQSNGTSCSPAIALLVTSIFTQLITLYELILEYITTRVERISCDPIPSISGVMFNGLPLEDSFAQGLLFCQAIVYLMERTEIALGTRSSTGAGLLSARQVKVLWGELDSRQPIIADHAIMRPSTLRRLFGKVAGIFGQIVGDSLHPK
ncbi:c6 zinc finger domain-containing protein [Fusarium heterosporum]|uniref:C6 zinc finger domain-containing protein n=1 Tax=Fusarium heterosporum TaxID=42747 RepID=A0A8H5THJ7_FUSHE|nr:c6 zinc finger domain-containing protein [Fusarium heterosporum]